MIYPLILMIVLSILVTLRLIFIAIRLLITRKVHIKQFRLFDGDIPKHALAARAHFKNMFEIPILFYVWCILLIVNESYTQIDVFIAWGFAISRLLHSIVRIPNKDVYVRFFFFMIGLMLLSVGWVRFILTTI